jgi:hypothetical protein
MSGVLPKRLQITTNTNSGSEIFKSEHFANYTMRYAHYVQNSILLTCFRKKYIAFHIYPDMHGCGIILLINSQAVNPHDLNMFTGIHF